MCEKYSGAVQNIGEEKDDYNWWKHRPFSVIGGHVPRLPSKYAYAWNNIGPTRYEYFVVESQNVELQSTMKTTETTLKEFEAQLIARHADNDKLRLKGMLHFSIIPCEFIFLNSDYFW